MPKINRVWRTRGVAGQYAVSAAVQYPDEPSRIVTFVGSTFGGPVVMVRNVEGTEVQTFVSRDVTSRLGSTLDEAWVRGFFA